MLYVYYGTDIEEVRKKALAVLAEKGLVIERLETDSYAPGLLPALLGSAPLFGESSAYLIDNPSGEESFFEECVSLAKELSDSSTIFVIVEKTVLAAPKKKFEAAGAVLSEFKKVAKEEFNAFAMADALASKDKRTLWLLLQRAKAEGMVSEEIIGTLWWQLKTMRLAAVSKTAEEAGIKEYPFKKAKAALGKFPLMEVERQSRELLRIGHESRRGNLDLELGLEAWVLSL
jgi:DNA polymerase III delta subunit